MLNTLKEFTMKNTENKYWFADVSQSISSRLIEVECYTLQDDEKVATIELKYNYNEDAEEWQVESTQFHTNPTIKEIGELIEELLRRANDLFHEFCHECYVYNGWDDEDSWFV